MEEGLFLQYFRDSFQDTFRDIFQDTFQDCIEFTVLSAGNTKTTKQLTAESTGKRFHPLNFDLVLLQGTHIQFANLI